MKEGATLQSWKIPQIGFNFFFDDDGHHVLHCRENDDDSAEYDDGNAGNDDVWTRVKHFKVERNLELGLIFMMMAIM